MPCSYFLLREKGKTISAICQWILLNSEGKVPGDQLTREGNSTDYQAWGQGYKIAHGFVPLSSTKEASTELSNINMASITASKMTAQYTRLQLTPLSTINSRIFFPGSALPNPVCILFLIKLKHREQLHKSSWVPQISSKAVLSILAQFPREDKS